jgi:orotidine-5'-phosphate decarboxylase
MITSITEQRQRLFVALDMPDLATALRFTSELRPTVGGFKVGLELCTSVGVPRVVEAIAANGGRLFLDLKLHDIPNTVARTVSALGSLDGAVRMLTLHCHGGAAMLRAAAEAAAGLGPERPLLLGVTVLTSLDAPALYDELQVAVPLGEHVLHLARMAQACGLDGVVASPHEAAAIRAACGPELLIVTPGVRPTWATDGDQRRTLGPLEALNAGADYLVVGRPITAPPTAVGTSVAAAARIVAEMEA